MMWVVVKLELVAVGTEAVSRLWAVLVRGGGALLDVVAV